MQQDLILYGMEAPLSLTHTHTPLEDPELLPRSPPPVGVAAKTEKVPSLFQQRSKLGPLSQPNRASLCVPSSRK